MVAFLIALSLMGFDCGGSSEPGPCEPPCTDNDGQVCLLISQTQVDCACTCPHGQLHLIFRDPATHEVVKHTIREGITGGTEFCTLPDVPTCTDLELWVVYKCTDDCYSNTYWNQLFPVRLPCGTVQNILMNLECLRSA